MMSDLVFNAYYMFLCERCQFIVLDGVEAVYRLLENYGPSLAPVDMLANPSVCSIVKYALYKPARIEVL